MVIEYKRIKEGKVDFFADRNGVLKIDKEKLENKETTDLSDKEIKMYLKLVEWASVGRVDYWNRLTKEEK